MKLKDIIEDSMEIKEYLQELIGDDDRVEMGIKFKNLKMTYILPEIFEKDIDKSASKLFKKENGKFVVSGEGADCIEDVKKKIENFEKILIDASIEKK